MILVGVIIGPKEPSLHLNSYLHPLVNELKRLWNGILLEDHYGRSLLVRAALLCCSCDIPASRKLCGFVGHDALMGCNECLLPFPTI